MMSGTSLDSIDACLLNIYEDLTFDIIGNYSLAYPKTVKLKLFDLANNNGSVSDVCFMNFVVGNLFADCANNLLKKVHYKNENSYQYTAH